MGKSDYVIWAVAIVLLLPALVSPAGVLVAILLVAAWLAVSYGGRFYMKLKLNEHIGAKSRGTDVRDLVSGNQQDPMEEDRER